MKRVAIVVQRSHESIAGGSESLALQYATLLSEAYRVDVLTTTALDIPTWANALPEGVERHAANINIHRFRVTLGRTSYWFNLNTRLQKDFELYKLGREGLAEGARLPWSLALQEEYIRRQGPHSAPLMKFLRERWPDYQAIIFVTYLYPTTYFGLLEIPVGRGLIVPTLHDEQPAYLSAYKYMVRRARKLIWLTEAERRLGLELWGDMPGQVTAMSIETNLREPAQESVPYLLYCGRVDPNKGCPELFDYFSRFKKEFPSELRLILIGEKTMSLPEHDDIEFRGFVEHEEKFRLMAGATVFVTPSRNESFSIVTLEAMGQRTPVLANGDCEVLFDHVTQSNAGRLFNDYESFAVALKEMLSKADELTEMGRRGRDYIVSRYGRKQVQKSLMEAVESCAESQEAKGEDFTVAAKPVSL
ncbi:MAG TPA: glycosyltransferase family 4 protein [Pyrinomonadaceae bacterium]|jgi:glycosyltransferase involved in cell wall biosynthesis